MLKKEVVEKKKICFVGNCQSVHLQRWINYFKDRFEVYIISSKDCEHDYCIHVDDIVPGILIRIPKVRFIALIFFLRNLLRRKGVDLIHIHSLNDFNTLLGFAFSILHWHPLVVSTWGSDVAGPKASRLSRIKRYVLKKADLVTAICGFIARETRILAPEIKRLEIVPFGVDLKVFDHSAVGRGLVRSKESLRVGFFKHLKEIYGPEYLIKAFAVVSKKFDDAELFLAGEGELKEELENLAKKLEVSRKVHFLGFVENVSKIMASMDVTVVPSLSEGLPVAALESEALQVPVIATRVGGLPEVVEDGKTGFLFSPRDDKALAKAMIKLLSNKDLRLKMGKAGRKLVLEKYSWEKNAKKMERLYEKVLAPKANK